MSLYLFLFFLFFIKSSGHFLLPFLRGSLMLYVCFFASLLPTEKVFIKRPFLLSSVEEIIWIFPHIVLGWPSVVDNPLKSNYWLTFTHKPPASTLHQLPCSEEKDKRENGVGGGGHKYVKNYSPVLLPSLNQHLLPGTTLLPRRSSSHNSNFPSPGMGCHLRLGRTPDLPLWHFALGLVRSRWDPTRHAWPLITVRITFMSILVSGGKMLVNMHFRYRVQQT